MKETPAIADDVFHCWDGDDDDSDYHNPYYDSENNENNFPPFQFSSEPQVEDSNGNGPSGNYEQKSNGVGAEDSFASDFYRGGTDWSCLLQIGDDDEDEKKKKRLKQTNLFQMWGFHKMNPPTKSDDNAASSSSSSLHLNKKKKSEKGLVVGSGNRNNSSVAVVMARESSSRGTTCSDVFPRVCPFYKKIPGTPFTVDAFRYGHVKGCSAYFLSHFHADHYGGLNKGWSHGNIYCTPLTARLVRMHLCVNPSFIRPLELGTENIIEGIKVTMLEANHCPGAALIHFRLPNGQCYLHTGDFRASKLMQAYPLLSNRRINVLYLDTTYCNPKYRFPSKEDVLNFVVRVTKSCMKKQPSTLVIVGAYSIGKESVYLAISKALGLKIYANPSRRRTLQSFGWPEISGNLSMHGKDTPLHVLPISSLRFEILERYLKTYKSQYTAILAFRPTGWTYSETIGSQLDLIKPSSKGIVTIYGVPYSEHSSFTELREFVQFLRPEKIIPTVNVGNAANRDKMQSYFREWMKG